jgi:hypothetical protein
MTKTAPEKAVYEKMLAESGWTPADGPVPGYWEKRQPGSRCLWSCVWITADGLVPPEILEPPLGEPALKIINNQVVHVGAPGVDAVDLEMVDARANSKTYNRILGKSLSEIRRDYLEFVWPYGSAPKDVFKHPIRLRPDYPQPAWYTPR